MTALTPEEFMELFRQVKHAARRLENRGRYDVAYETPEREAFLAGERSPERPERFDDWDLNLRERTAAGARFERVRVMEDPLTPYNRFMIWSNAQNSRNGEDIRYLDRNRANELNLPDHDFWVFDSTQLVLMRFTKDDRSLGHDLITDPGLIARHEAWIDLAMAHATPWRDYVAEDHTRAEPPIRLHPEVTTGGP
ncbi:hypothetical protein GCM10023321_71170 [Pseudonocardia eucalypti]|uniref:DUF6879 domain-containing protein n=1 Tax=Pseudonocardia eucalypti TaxID=648755 RepID=A0ABP9R665_9PSEU|nr:hypothetical protein [Pseudonocardia eucalypti]